MQHQEQLAGHCPRKYGKRTNSSMSMADDATEMFGKWPRLTNEHIDIDDGDSPEVAAEVEVEIDVNSKSEPQLNEQKHQILVVSDESQPTQIRYSSYGAADQINPMEMEGTSRATMQRRTRRGPSQYTAQQLIKFDPMQCFDIDELRNRMVAAQRRIEDSTSIHLNYNKLKSENFMLREELLKRDYRIRRLESVVMERNERIKELLKENVFMRAQIKKIQNEFGVDAVKEVFNRGITQKK